MSVDIVIPTYNRADLLPATLESVRRQTHADWTCWIAEDGETAATREAIAGFLEDPRFRYLPGPHSGLPATGRNRGVQAGTAPYIAFLDDDDLWLPERLERQLALLAARPDVLAVASDAHRWAGGAEAAGGELYLPAGTARGQIDFATLLNGNLVINSSVLLRREALERVGPLNEDPALRAIEDYELWLRLAACGPWWILPEPLLCYRDAPQASIRRQQSLERHYQVMACLYGSVAGRLEREQPDCARLARARAAHFAAGPSALLRLRVGLKRWLTGGA